MPDLGGAVGGENQRTCWRGGAGWVGARAVLTVPEAGRPTSKWRSEGRTKGGGAMASAAVAVLSENPETLFLDASELLLRYADNILR